MPGKKRKNVRNVNNNARSVGNRRNVDLSGYFVKSISEGNLANVQNLIHSHGLSCCEGWYGGYALLRDAIESGHFEIAKFLLQVGAKVDCGTDCVSTLLHFATAHRNVELVQLLLDKDVRIDARNGKKETALHLAAEAGYVEIVDLLLKSNASIMAQTIDNSTPFVLAVENVHFEIVQMLLTYASAFFKDKNDRSSVENKNSTALDCVLLCDPSVRARVNAIIVQILEYHVEDLYHIVDYLIDNGLVLSPEYVSEWVLQSAISLNRTNVIRSILTSTIPKNAAHNLRLLHSAVEKREERIVKMFVNFGYEAGAENEEEDDGPRREEYGLAKAVQMLLANGATIKEIPELLHTFIEKDMIEVCKILVKNGADVNALNTRGETPLHLSCEGEYKEESRQKKDEIIKILLHNNADVNIKTPKDGLTAGVEKKQPKFFLTLE